MLFYNFAIWRVFYLAINIFEQVPVWLILVYERLLADVAAKWNLAILKQILALTCDVKTQLLLWRWRAPFKLVNLNCFALTVVLFLKQIG